LFLSIRIKKDEDIVPISSIKKERPSDPGKQGLAGLSDILTGIPIIAGFAGAGLEAAAKTPFNDKGFVDTFKESASSGVDSSLINFGADLREGVNNLLGIKEPVSTEDQVARLAASLLPIPGFRAVAGAGKLARLGKSTFNVLTPAVKYTRTSTRPFRDKLVGKVIEGTLLNRGNVGRVGAQLGIGVGLEQGLRALADNPELPLLFSDKALTGREPVETQQEGAPPMNDLQGGGGVDQLVSASKTPSEEIIPLADIIPEELVPLAEIIPDAPQTNQALVKAQQDVEDEQNRVLMRNIALGTGAAIAVLLGVRFNKKLLMAKTRTVSGLDQVSRNAGEKSALATVQEATKNASEGTINKLKAASDSIRNIAAKRGSRLFGAVFDSTGNIEAHLRSIGATESDIAQLAGQEITDARGTTAQFLKDGKFGQGSPTIVRSLHSIHQEFLALNPKEQQQFLDGVAFIREDVARTRATAFHALKKDKNNQLTDLRKAFDEGTIDDIALVQKEQADFIEIIRGKARRERPGLFNINAKGKRVFIGDPQLLARIKAFEANPRFVQMHKALTRINDAVLEEAVRRGAKSKEWADAVRRQFTKDGRLTYIPGKENVERAAWLNRQAAAMGFHTTSGKILRGVANWHLQGLVEGHGIQSPLDAFEATANYAYQVMDDVNRSIKQWNVLTRLTGLKLGPDGTAISILPKFKDSLKPTRYIGSSSMDDPLSQGGNIHVRFNMDDPKIAERFGVKESGTFTPEQLVKMDDAIWVQRGSSWHGFYVPDRQLKKALEFDAALHNRLLEFSNYWRGVFTADTTGRFSAFGPTAFAFNHQISTFTAILRATKAEGATLGNVSREAFEVWKDSYKGAWESFSVAMAEDYADILTRAIQTRSALYKSNPRLIRQIRVVLKNKVRRTLMSPIEREVGRSATGYSGREFSGDLTNTLAPAVPYVAKLYGAGALPRIWRIWNHLNTAMHEGTALGITMRKAHEAALKNPEKSFSVISRQARKDAIDLVGSVNLRGSSDIAKAFHAVVPYSGPMLQAWSTLGRAFKVAGVRRALGATIAAIGLPTALEVTYNSTLDSDQLFPDPAGPDPLTGITKMWSYRDYFWNGYTTEQRANYRIVMIPGKPPWEASIERITPELSLFRGIVIDTMEVLFNLSQEGLDHGNHSLAALVRIFDVPLNPVMAAVASGFGLDVRAGIIPDDVQGKGFSFVQGRQLFHGTRAGADARIKFEGNELEKDTTAILQDIFGAVGTLMVGIYEGFNAGNEQTSLSTRAEFAMDELGRNVIRQVKFFQPIFGKSLRTAPNRDNARDLVGKKSALQRAKNNLEPITSGALFSGGKLSRGNTISSTSDPIAIMLSASAKTYLDAIKPFDEAISDLRGQIQKLGTSTEDRFAYKGITVKQRDDIIDSLNLRIGAYQAQQLSILKQFEEEFARSVYQNIGVDISGFEFNNFQPKPTPAGSASLGLPKLPRTSQ